MVICNQFEQKYHNSAGQTVTKNSSVSKIAKSSVYWILKIGNYKLTLILFLM